MTSGGQRAALHPPQWFQDSDSACLDWWQAILRACGTPASFRTSSVGHSTGLSRVTTRAGPRGGKPRGSLEIRNFPFRWGWTGVGKALTPPLSSLSTWPRAWTKPCWAGSHENQFYFWEPTPRVLSAAAAGWDPPILTLTNIKVLKTKLNKQTKAAKLGRGMVVAHAINPRTQLRRQRQEDLLS